MVNQEVLVKKERSFKKPIIIILMVLIIAIILFLIFYLGAIFGSVQVNPSVNYTNPVIEIMNEYKARNISINQSAIIDQAEEEFDESYIDFVLFAMGAWKLHNPPLSKETPKIEFVMIDSGDVEEVFNAEVIEGTINTDKGMISNEDIVIRTTKKEVIGAMLVEDMEDYMEKSVREGRTTIEMIANKVKLGTKGYLQMYQDITGEELI